MSTARLEAAQAQAVVRRLNAFRHLSEAAVKTLKEKVSERILRLGAGQDLVSEGEQPNRIRVVLSGWLSRYKTLEDGRRQIVNFVLPGETCDAHVYLLSRMDHAIGTLTPVVYSEIEPEDFEKLAESDRRLAEALPGSPDEDAAIAQIGDLERQLDERAASAVLVGTRSRDQGHSFDR